LTSDLAVTADGQRAVCLYSGKLREVELATGRIIRSFTPSLTAPHGRNQQVVLSPGGRWLAAGDDDVVRLWDFATGAVAWSDPEAARSKSRCLAFAPDGSRLLVANRFGPATLYTPDSLRPSRLPAHWNSLRASAFFPDGKRAVLAGDDRAVRIWDVSASPPKVVHVLTGPRPSVQAVAVARGGRYVLAVGDDGVLFGWDADTGSLAFVTDPDGGIQGVAVGPDGATAVTGHKDGSVRVWALPE
jgi:WD40 repeat protein